MIKNTFIRLKAHPRGFHLITDELLYQLNELPESGLLQLFIQHSSAGLLINENADPDVRHDMNMFFDKIVPENEDYFRHIMEGADDMPAHIKAALTGNSLSIPIIDGKLGLGTWQGIYLCEFRNNGGSRKIVATIISGCP
ncbi:MAG: secondary thiamine-phosphate synthase enzyme YjbQ [Bacteroidetes bacterium]|nr:secondary thiamine-phosphate synthase enzyme YjbQ [Bacteroidota bacterium]MBU1577887.1 secondary thiamine-phosphate synthase enzyme YjbQ [Bacteroidota bacterium]MBU2558479.1 secondary thiamine-phosphate synthase enzyme YjbQ [Bacteroidota bacterium]